jgi:hypothetical protein
MPKEAKQMTENQLKTIILRGGANLNKSLEVVNVSKGYLVSVPSKFAKVLTIDTDYATMLKAMQDMSTEINVDGLGAYVGLWVDEGKLYIDLSINFNDRQVALNIAREFNQKAIWDATLDKSIKV